VPDFDDRILDRRATLVRGDDGQRERERKSGLAFGHVPAEERLIANQSQAIGIRTSVSDGVIAHDALVVPPVVVDVVVELDPVGVVVESPQAAAVSAIAAAAPNASSASRLVSCFIVVRRHIPLYVKNMEEL
jgi:hypothetical protein